MRLLHLADLHIGKKFYGFSLIEDQRHFFNETIKFIKLHNIDTVVIAGDIYDVSVPSSSSMVLLDEFLTNLSDNNITTLLIPGNHDSDDRFTYAKGFFKKHNIHIVNKLSEGLNPIVINDINFYLIPFINYHEVNSLFDTDFKDLDSAFKYLIEKLNIDNTKTNILVSHQLILPSNNEISKEGSEDFVFSDTTTIKSSSVSIFDYVALGHIHKPQTIGFNMRYCGSPLAYHTDEAKLDKSYTVVDIDNKNVSYNTYKITPLKDVIILKGEFKELLLNNRQYENEYVYLKLTNKELIDNVMDKAREVFKYCIHIDYVINESSDSIITDVVIDKINMIDLFKNFYLKQNGEDISEYQLNIVKELMEEDYEA